MRYWTKIEEAVEGPYDAGVMKFIEGFGPELWVSPDDPDNPEVWMKAVEVGELKPLLGIRAETPEPAVLPEPQDTPGLGTIEEVWIEETVSSLALLEVMEKISEFRKEKKVVSEQPPAPAAVIVQKPIVILPPSVDEGVSTLEISPDLIRRILFISAAAIALIAGTYLGVRKGIFHRTAPAVPREIRLQTPNRDQKPPSESLETQKIKSLPAKAKKVQELKSQKFMLPGVPSPNLKSTKTAEEPSPEEKPAEESPDKEHSNSDKQKEGKKSDKGADWQSQSGWGQ